MESPRDLLRLCLGDGSRGVIGMFALCICSKTPTNRCSHISSKDNDKSKITRCKKSDTESDLLHQLPFLGRFRHGTDVSVEFCKFHLSVVFRSFFLRCHSVNKGNRGVQSTDTSLLQKTKPEINTDTHTHTHTHTQTHTQTHKQDPCSKHVTL